MKTAGGIAVGGAALAAGATEVSASSRKSAVPFAAPTFAPTVTTAYADITDVTALNANLTYGAALSGSVYTTGLMAISLEVPAGATLLSAGLLVKGPGSITAELWCQDMTNGGYVGGPAPFTTPGQDVAAVTAVPPVGGLLAIPVPSNYVVPGDHRLQIWTVGVSAGTPTSGAKYTYQTAAAGFFPITPTRVYDSRDSGSGGLLASDATRTVSVANATAFSGGAANVVPAGAYAITYNLTAVNTTGAGFLAVFPQGGTFKASALNWFTVNEIIANGGVVTLGGDRQITVLAGGGGSTNFIVDITGYYI